MGVGCTKFRDFSGLLIEYLGFTESRRAKAIVDNDEPVEDQSSISRIGAEASDALSELAIECKQMLQI